jgi:fluoride exporter
MMLRMLLIALGGAVGSIARYGTGTLLLSPTERTGFPWGTLAVNLVGCLLIGYLNGLITDGLLRAEYRFLVVIGFLGGYTTFSSFGWETAALLRDGQYARAIFYVLGNNVTGVLLVVLGYALSRLHR